MTHRKHRLLVHLISAATLASVAAVLLENPANADELSRGDAVRDVRLFNPDDAASTAVPKHGNGDLKRYVVKYGQSRIRIVLRFRELDHSEPVLALAGTFTYPGNGQQNYAEALVKARRGDWGGTAWLTNNAKCVVKHHIDYANNRATISFATHCFESPRWVRFYAVAVTTDNWHSPTYFYGDRAPGTFRAERWTKRLYRG